MAAVVKHVRKKKGKKFLFFSVFFFFLIIYLSYSLFVSINKIISINSEKKELETRIVGLQEEEKQLQKDIQKLEDPTYIARYAREKYLYSKDGELIIRFDDETDEDK